ncbi:hypothetical protein Syun_031527 [Stephania yunnanensis]|uniref:Uncharacterized protein n=1 Tax=Stephania yunnanensis TaxID=152371 RepID=A0AAP0E0K9_9MAGN
MAKDRFWMDEGMRTHEIRRQGIGLGNGITKTALEKRDMENVMDFGGWRESQLVGNVANSPCDLKGTIEAFAEFGTASMSNRGLAIGS